MNLQLYNNKKVLITGHTGFKGAWLCKILNMANANIIGYSLEPPTTPNLFEIANISKNITSIIGDIRDLEKLKKVFEEFQPEIVFHLAAQPIVKESYKNPVYTYTTNVIGTVNILECTRLYKCVKSILNITTDKVYENKEWEWGFRENEPLDGYDPYSNSKSCSELVTHSYKASFFDSMKIRVSTARAGNVIGGGDFGKDRIIPDSINAVLNNKKIIVRNPYSIRPYQHVLEALYVYLMIAIKQLEDEKYQGYYNVGPDECDCITTGELVKIFCDKWKNSKGWESKLTDGPHEANFLKLDCSRLKKVFGWKPKWNIEQAITKTIEWVKCYQDGQSIENCMETQIKEFFNI